jgi:hypothetical protein
MFDLCTEEYMGLSAAVHFSAPVPAVRCTSALPTIAFSVGGLRFGAASIRQPLISFNFIQLNMCQVLKTQTG